MIHACASEDLRRFAISPSDIDAWELTQIDFDVVNRGQTFPGYVIPYYTRDGAPINFRRIRRTDLADNPVLGFVTAAKDAIPHVYYPQGFQDCVDTAVPVSVAKEKRRPLFIVDDERVAAGLVHAHNRPAVAVPGPAGWRTPKSLAVGLTELVEWACDEDYYLVIWFGHYEEPAIQREAAELGFELRAHGVPFTHVRQYLHAEFQAGVLQALMEKRSGFPCMPLLRRYINERIQDGAVVDRRDSLNVSAAILADLERGGFRVRSLSDGALYYFDERARQLTQISLPTGSRDLVVQSDFQEILHRKYGIYGFDTSVLRPLSSTLSVEQPVYRTHSHKLLLTTPRFTHNFCLQLTASEFVMIDVENGVEEAVVVNNGTSGILFDKASTEPIDVNLFNEQLRRQRAQLKIDKTLPCWWLETLTETNFAEATDPNHALVLALLYYVSPWLLGWREIQMPIEVITGEPGSGKSSLFELRLKIQTGQGDLKNVPDNLRSWQAMVVNSAGMLVMDNVHTIIKSLMQSFSDEMCRLTTQSNPTIELKQLYTTSDVARCPVGVAFGITSITNVFKNVDFLQRAIVTRLQPRPSGGASNFAWVPSKLEEHGGREAWLAHHVLAVEQFLKRAVRGWDNAYMSHSRLINFEQTMGLMADVFGLDGASIPKVLKSSTQKNIATMDWVVEGLIKFAEFWRRKGKKATFKATDLTDWAKGTADFADNKTLTNPRILGNYIRDNRILVRTQSGIMIDNDNGKSITYRVSQQSEV